MGESLKDELTCDDKPRRQQEDQSTEHQRTAVTVSANDQNKNDNKGVLDDRSPEQNNADLAGEEEFSKKKNDDYGYQILTFTIFDEGKLGMKIVENKVPELLRKKLGILGDELVCCRVSSVVEDSLSERIGVLKNDWLLQQYNDISDAENGSAREYLGPAPYDLILSQARTGKRPATFFVARENPVTASVTTNDDGIRDVKKSDRVVQKDPAVGGSSAKDNIVDKTDSASPPVTKAKFEKQEGGKRSEKLPKKIDSWESNGNGDDKRGTEKKVADDSHKKTDENAVKNLENPKVPVIERNQNPGVAGDNDQTIDDNKGVVDDRSPKQNNVDLAGEEEFSKKNNDDYGYQILTFTIFDEGKLGMKIEENKIPELLRKKLGILGDEPVCCRVSNVVEDSLSERIGVLKNDWLLQQYNDISDAENGSARKHLGPAPCDLILSQARTGKRPTTFFVARENAVTSSNSVPAASVSALPIIEEKAHAAKGSNTEVAPKVTENKGDENLKGTTEQLSVSKTEKEIEKPDVGEPVERTDVVLVQPTKAAKNNNGTIRNSLSATKSGIIEMRSAPESGLQTEKMRLEAGQQEQHCSNVQTKLKASQGEEEKDSLPASPSVATSVATAIENDIEHLHPPPSNNDQTIEKNPPVENKNIAKDDKRRVSTQVIEAVSKDAEKEEGNPGDRSTPLAFNLVAEKILTDEIGRSLKAKANLPPSGELNEGDLDTKSVEDKNNGDKKQLAKKENALVDNLTTYSDRETNNSESDEEKCNTTGSKNIDAKNETSREGEGETPNAVKTNEGEKPQELKTEITSSRAHSEKNKGHSCNDEEDSSSNHEIIYVKIERQGSLGFYVAEETIDADNCLESLKLLGVVLGEDTERKCCCIGDLRSGSLAEEVGLKTGDIFLQLGQQLRLSCYEEVLSIAQNGERPLTFAVARERSLEQKVRDKGSELRVVTSRRGSGEMSNSRQKCDVNVEARSTAKDYKKQTEKEKMTSSISESYEDNIRKDDGRNNYDVIPISIAQQGALAVHVLEESTDSKNLPETLKAENSGNIKCCCVGRVFPGGLGEQAGLKEGDWFLLSNSQIKLLPYEVLLSMAKSGRRPLLFNIARKRSNAILPPDSSNQAAKEHPIIIDEDNKLNGQENVVTGSNLVREKYAGRSLQHSASSNLTKEQQSITVKGKQEKGVQDAKNQNVRKPKVDMGYEVLSFTIDQQGPMGINILDETVNFKACFESLKSLGVAEGRGPSCCRIGEVHPGSLGEKSGLRVDDWFLTPGLQLQLKPYQEVLLSATTGKRPLTFVIARKRSTRPTLLPAPMVKTSLREKQIMNSDSRQEIENNKSHRLTTSAEERKSTSERENSPSHRKGTHGQLHPESNNHSGYEIVYVTINRPGTMGVDIVGERKNSASLESLKALGVAGWKDDGQACCRAGSVRPGGLAQECGLREGDWFLSSLPQLRLASYEETVAKAQKGIRPLKFAVARRKPILSPACSGQAGLRTKPVAEDTIKQPAGLRTRPVAEDTIKQPTASTLRQEGSVDRNSCHEIVSITIERHGPLGCSILDESVDDNTVLESLKLLGVAVEENGRQKYCRVGEIRSGSLAEEFGLKVGDGFLSYQKNERTSTRIETKLQPRLASYDEVLSSAKARPLKFVVVRKKSKKLFRAEVRGEGSVPVDVDRLRNNGRPRGEGKDRNFVDSTSIGDNIVLPDTARSVEQVQYQQLVSKKRKTFSSWENDVDFDKVPFNLDDWRREITGLMGRSLVGVRGEKQQGLRGDKLEPSFGSNEVNRRPRGSLKRGSSFSAEQLRAWSDAVEKICEDDWKAPSDNDSRLQRVSKQVVHTIATKNSTGGSNNLGTVAPKAARNHADTLIEQVDLQSGKFVEMYTSIEQAARDNTFVLKEWIAEALKGDRREAGGFLWRYVFDKEEGANTFRVPTDSLNKDSGGKHKRKGGQIRGSSVGTSTNQNNHQRKRRDQQQHSTSVATADKVPEKKKSSPSVAIPVEQLDPGSGLVVATYPSFDLACRVNVGIPQNLIRDALSGRLAQVGGFKWQYTVGKEQGGGAGTEGPPKIPVKAGVGRGTTQITGEVTQVTGTSYSRQQHHSATIDNSATIRNTSPAEKKNPQSSKVMDSNQHLRMKETLNNKQNEVAGNEESWNRKQRERAAGFEILSVTIEREGPLGMKIVATEAPVKEFKLLDVVEGKDSKKSCRIDHVLDGSLSEKFGLKGGDWFLYREKNKSELKLATYEQVRVMATGKRPMTFIIARKLAIVIDDDSAEIRDVANNKKSDTRQSNQVSLTGQSNPLRSTGLPNNESKQTNHGANVAGPSPSIAIPQQQQKQAPTASRQPNQPFYRPMLPQYGGVVPPGLQTGVPQFYPHPHPMFNAPPMHHAMHQQNGGTPAPLPNQGQHGGDGSTGGIGPHFCALCRGFDVNPPVHHPWCPKNPHFHRNWPQPIHNRQTFPPA